MQPSAAHKSAPRTDCCHCELSTAGPEMSGNSDVFTLEGTTSGWMLFRQALVAAVRCVRARACLTTTSRPRVPAPRTLGLCGTGIATGKNA
jgi:hypothetical protein